MIFRLSSRSMSGARIGVRSRRSVTASASFKRFASSSTSLVWSFHTVTSCPRILAKHGKVRIVFCQSSRIAMFIPVSSVVLLDLDLDEDDLAGGLVPHVVLDARLAEVGLT